MDLTSSEEESDSNSRSESEDEDEVFSKLSCSDLNTFVQELMRRCQEKARHMKILKKKYDLLKIAIYNVLPVEILQRLEQPNNMYQMQGDETGVLRVLSECNVGRVQTKE